MISSPSRDRFFSALPVRRLELAGAAATWIGCAAGLGGRGWPMVAAAMVVVVVVVAAAVAAAIGRRRASLALVLAGLVAAGWLSGSLAAGRAEANAAAPVTPGRHQIMARVLTDPTAGRYGAVMLARASGPSMPAEVTVLVSLDDLDEPGAVEGIAAGDLVSVDGILADRPGRHRGDPYRAALDADSVELAAQASGPFFRPGNLLRRVVLERVGGDGSAAAGLVAGFLVGDTDGIPDDRMEDLRQAGLTHYVAVSGSNVAVFLAAWWLVVGPLGLEPRLRALLGIAALGVFVVATRWEPSVVRAATMAGIVLGGRVAGVPVDPWRATGVAVTGLLLFTGDLAGEIGFQLSVAATVGVLVAVRLVPDRRPKPLWTALAVTGGAQVAVLPIVLLHFGTVPLLSPVANLVAAPLVTTATVLAGIGAVTGFAPLLDVGLLAARGVLTVAATAAGWPQVGFGGIVLAAGAAAVLALSGRWRPVLALAGVAAMVAWGLPAPVPSFPAVVFLDVGQGDAILLRHPPGSVVLVDGGPDPAVLTAALRRHAVTDIDLVIVTHGDADHVGGLESILDRHRVAEIWYPADQVNGELLDDLLAGAAARHIPVAAVGAGDGREVGPLHLEVLGPRRRYAADNDGSVVTRVSAGGIDVLLTGDVEAIAQAELELPPPEVLQVPHHGSATTDLDWLAATVGEVAVISVGQNTFGHPRPEVLATLEVAGATVLTTLDDGDVVIPLCPCP